MVEGLSNWILEFSFVLQKELGELFVLVGEDFSNVLFTIVE